MYTRFSRSRCSQGVLLEAYKAIEALWEILSPSARSCAITSTLSGVSPSCMQPFATPTPTVLTLWQIWHTRLSFSLKSRLRCHGLGNLTKSVTFDLRTLTALRKESGPDEAKVFNLVRGLQTEVESEPELESVLRPLKERAESVLKGLEERTTTGLAAMDILEALAKEKEAVVVAARDSILPPKGVRGVLDAEGRRCSSSRWGERDGVRRRGPGARGPLSQRRRKRRRAATAKDFTIQPIVEGRKR